MKIFLLVFLLIISSCSSRDKSSEIQKFHVLGTVKYRCYAGYSGKKVYDVRTNELCDNETYEKRIFDKKIQVELNHEPGPDNSPDWAGSWLETAEFKGRTYTIALTVFKTPGKGYRIRLVATDDEKLTRSTAVFLQTPTISSMNPVTIDFFSAGTKEEISFLATLNAVP